MGLKCITKQENNKTKYFIKDEKDTYLENIDEGLFLKLKDLWNKIKNKDESLNEDKINEFNASIINYLNTKAPEHAKYIKDKIVQIDDLKLDHYILSIDNIKSNFGFMNDFMYRNISFNENGLISKTSIKEILDQFKDKMVLKSIVYDSNFANKLKNSTTLKNPNYKFYYVNNDDEALIHTIDYDFKETQTIIYEYYSIFNWYKNNKDDYLEADTIIALNEQFNRSTEFFILDTSKTTKQILVGTFASFRQIANNKIPAFKNIQKTKITKSDDKDLYNIGHISCKIQGKVYYLYEFNDIFKNSDYKFYIQKNFDYGGMLLEYENGAYLDEDQFISKTYNRFFGEYEENAFYKNILNSDFYSIFKAYVKLFVFAYVNKFLANETQEEKKRIMTAIINNFKQTTFKEFLQKQEDNEKKIRK